MLSTEVRPSVRDVVKSQLLAGHSKGEIKAQVRSQLGTTPNAEIEAAIRDVKSELSRATETPADHQAALNRFRLWYEIYNLAYGQIRARERVHQAMELPPPNEIVKVPRSWGESAPDPETAIHEVAQRLRELAASLAPVSNTGTGNHG